MKKAVGLTEVMVGALLLATVFAGILTTFLGVRKYISRSGKRLTAVSLARRKLNDLYRAVREDWWGDTTKPLYGDNAGVTTDLTRYTIDGLIYGASPNQNSYQVWAIPGPPAQDYRRVRVVINYPAD